MKTLCLPIDQIQSPQEVVQLLESGDLRPGDRLTIVTEEDKNLAIVAFFLLLGLALLAYFNKEQREQRIADGERILKDLFAKGDSGAMEKELETEYGIEIEFIREAPSDETSDWARRSLQSLAGSYSDDEPDYSDVALKESNPDYRPL